MASSTSDLGRRFPLPLALTRGAAWARAQLRPVARRLGPTFAGWRLWREDEDEPDDARAGGRRRGGASPSPRCSGCDSETATRGREDDGESTAHRREDDGEPTASGLENDREHDRGVRPTWRESSYVVD
uniref:Uncharacterized protein n=1 Tax=Leersia perrieri TaxID=77586 RepID=A0A0D9Y1L9_9ORYZ